MSKKQSIQVATMFLLAIVVFDIWNGSVQSLRFDAAVLMLNILGQVYRSLMTNSSESSQSE